MKVENLNQLIKHEWLVDQKSLTSWTTEQFQKHKRKFSLFGQFCFTEIFAILYTTPVFQIIKLSGIQNNQEYA